ncbi:response regulator [Acidisoma cellulosilytica]|uniref:Chemotaxis protein CheA n=1 Tax=Acidisoma cellulosilyticum TaxID=2802395 RepID=A0A963YZK1_9PROT|nr:response regulator [Acidisoma cellulosilyticum]MCB8879955.1 response regulator [Acidisoma cellulosilyticum]
MPPINPADLRQELLAAFEVEYREHLSVVRAGLGAARRGERADLKDIFRRLHSLKGAARAVDLPEVESRAHELEAQMASVIEAGRGLSRDRIAVLENGLDKVEAVIETAFNGADAEPGPAVARDEPAHGYLRIEAVQVTDLIVAATQLAQAVERQDGLQHRLAGIEAVVRRARRVIEPLLSGGNASPQLAELASELSQAVRQSALMRHDLRDSSWALDEALRRVRDDVDRMSLVPAETIFGPMARMVRDIARDEGVEAEPDFLGLGLQADRRVLQALKDPVLQLLRNAIGHGSETAARRRARGLPPATRITLALRSGGGMLTVRVTDDGPGPDLASIRARAVERGLLTEAAGRQASTDQLLALVFEPGFSTRAAVGQLSGRGMGLSIVAEAARSLGGSARMMMAAQTAKAQAGRGQGATVEISVPLLVARQYAVLLDFADVTVAIPAASLVRLLRVPVAQIEPLAGQMCVRIDGPANQRLAPVAVLGDLLGMGRSSLPVHDGHVKLAVIQTGVMNQRLALAVDHFQDARRFLSHSADLVGLDTELVAGLVMITSGLPAALLSPDGLMSRWGRLGGWSGEAGTAETIAEDEVDIVRTILVVDDSITSRTLEKSILEAHGYRVLVAVDGMEALDVLRRVGTRRLDQDEASIGGIDLVLADVEMPRMDGLTLLRTMKGDTALKDTPVIIMTSRNAADDIRRGLDLGASAYIAKQSFDQQDLLGAIGRLL